MLGIGMQEILIILVVALIIIGPKRLPELARTLGKGFAEFKKAADDLQETVRIDLEKDKHSQFKEKYPHLIPENDEDAKTRSAQDDEISPEAPPVAPEEPEPSYSLDEIEGGHDIDDMDDTEDESKDV